jgi:hypothetical protein
MTASSAELEKQEANHTQQKETGYPIAPNLWRSLKKPNASEVKFLLSKCQIYFIVQMRKKD